MITRRVSMSEERRAVTVLALRTGALAAGQAPPARLNQPEKETRMSTLKFRMAAALFALGALALSATVATEVRAQTPAVDPAAAQILKRMTDYLGSLQQFSVHTQNTLEDLLDSGHRVDFDVSASVIVGRPNKLRAERKGDLVEPDLLLRRQDSDAVQPVRQGLRDGACTRDDRGDARLRARVARARPPGRRPGLPRTPSRC